MKKVAAADADRKPALPARPFPRAENYQARNGRGAEGELDGHHYFVGNHRFAHELAVCSPALEQKLAEIEAQAQSVVVVIANALRLLRP